MAAQTGISGSTVIGNRVMMGGQVGLVDHLKIGDEAICIAQSGVIGDIPPHAMVSGYPARPHREVLRAQAEIRSIGRLRKKVKELEDKLSELLDNR
jgi:UDP-3-O-[3-hydroxymyristoyl] glucosamine N-acyltransferase